MAAPRKAGPANPPAPDALFWTCVEVTEDDGTWVSHNYSDQPPHDVVAAVHAFTAGDDLQFITADGSARWDRDRITGLRILDEAKSRPARWSWTLPAEPGPEVHRVKAQGRTAGSRSLSFNRVPDGGGWQLVVLGYPGEVVDWREACTIAIRQYGAEALVDATDGPEGHR